MKYAVGFSDKAPERWWGTGEAELVVERVPSLLKHLTSDSKASLSLRLGSASSSFLQEDLGRCLLVNCELLQDRGTNLAWLSLKSSHLAQCFKPLWIATEKAGEMRNKDFQMRKSFKGLRSISQGFRI